jgi:uncharacterized membrane protein
MPLAPVEYIVIAFPGNKFTGDVAPALAELVDRKLVRILDLLFITKDGDGNVLSFEIDQLDELGAFADVAGDSRGLMNDEDIEHAAEALEPNSSAALLIWEDLWAADFANALRAADGVVVEGGRIPHELAQAALDELAGG